MRFLLLISRISIPPSLILLLLFPSLPHCCFLDTFIATSRNRALHVSSHVHTPISVGSLILRVLLLLCSLLLLVYPTASILLNILIIALAPSQPAFL